MAVRLESGGADGPMMKAMGHQRDALGGTVVSERAEERPGVMQSTSLMVLQMCVWSNLRECFRSQQELKMQVLQGLHNEKNVKGLGVEGESEEHSIKWYIEEI